MKTLIVYYSRSGKNENLAKVLAKKLENVTVEEIVDKKNRDGSWGIFISLFDAIFRKMTQIEVVQNDPRDFHLVIIVSPLWAGSLPPATRTYLTTNRENFKKYAFLSVSNEGRDNRRAKEDIEKTAHQSPSPILLLNAHEFAAGAQKEIEEFVLNLA